MLICLLLFLTGTIAQAGPLWTIVPVKGSNPTQTVAENAEGHVRYLVQNQSSRSKQLVIWETTGVTQVAPCQLSPKGEANDSCILHLAITGRLLPQGGVDGGPRLCQANSNGSPNPNQCYWPSRDDSLKITRGPAVSALISVSPSTLIFPVDGIGSITITNSALSKDATQNLQIPIPHGSNVRIQSTTCRPNLPIGASCVVNFTAAAAQELTDIAISGSNTNTANVAVQTLSAPAMLTVIPTVVRVFEHQTFVVTVQNRITSQTGAQNVAPIIPSNSNISVSNNTCGASLAIGQSCTITLLAGTPEGPTLIAIAGSNTNTPVVSTTVTDQVQVRLSPEQSERIVPVGGGTPLSLTLTYDTIGGPVTSFTVVDHAACPLLSVNDTNCINLSSGNSCTLELSSNTPYVPCTITITGADPMPIAFSYPNGLIFEVNGMNGKMVADSSIQFKSTWTWISGSGVFNSRSATDGVANTDAIVVNSLCTDSPGNCAAQRCRNLGPEWYLPAVNEMSAVYNVLCPNFSCLFGDFQSYFWTSTQTSTYFEVLMIDFSSYGTTFLQSPIVPNHVRCMSQF